MKAAVASLPSSAILRVDQSIGRIDVTEIFSSACGSVNGVSLTILIRGASGSGLCIQAGSVSCGITLNARASSLRKSSPTRFGLSNPNWMAKDSAAAGTLPIITVRRRPGPNVRSTKGSRAMGVPAWSYQRIALEYCGLPPEFFILGRASIP